MEKESTTSNGYEIKRPTEKLDSDGYRSVLEKFGISGESPALRVEQLKGLSEGRLAALLTFINKGLQGSKDKLIHTSGAMKIGETSTIAPEHRYDVFVKLMNDIKQVPESVNPERVGDALAMGIVLLHPFEDGNGRTARMIGATFRDSLDSSDYESDFAALTEPRDEARARGGSMALGYTPRFPDGFDQSDPSQVSEYLHNLLTDEAEGSYIGPFGQARLIK